MRSMSCATVSPLAASTVRVLPVGILTKTRMIPRWLDLAGELLRLAGCLAAGPESTDAERWREGGHCSSSSGSVCVRVFVCRLEEVAVRSPPIIILVS